MFSSRKNPSQRDSFSYRAGKATTAKKQRSFKDPNRTSRIIAHTQQPSSSPQSHHQQSPGSSTPASPNLNSAILTISVGPTQRLFAAHEDVLCKSPYFAQACRAQFFETGNKRIDLPDEEPEVFSAVLEFLYKGDYTPRLAYDKRKASWYLESLDGNNSNGESTVYHNGVGGAVLKDTVIYCTAHRLSLPALQRLALKKQGLQSGVQCSTILSSARFAYAHTPASDSKLRAHYLALIIRSRATFKRSGTMQMEMERGGSAVWFDLFVAMVNHLDDVTGGK
ncbi:hypothetical protein B0A48_12431 [Cryoendolithus antarcticus]|uniref:BTB domain-containing protein n=1 Tax=Cryoendolithus antarcticus TaxID=1507870 RepID=A0A1V8SSG4_9PEZI|nr:hypothetical protein B0A48_12431 [Cryoendolithus antarcticus]OQO30535.1 hypothetical protein B0A51_02384 [Rachicladosporium sp. CCFEE 5018]